MNPVETSFDELDEQEQEFFRKIEEEKGSVADPENFMENPEEYIMKLKRY